MVVALAPAHVESFRALLERRFGWQYDDSKLEALEDLLRQRMEASGLQHVESYIERLLSLTCSRNFGPVET